MAAPLPPDNFPAAEKFEAESLPVAKVPPREDGLPKAPQGIFHGEMAFTHAEPEALSPCGMILKLDGNGHNKWFL